MDKKKSLCQNMTYVIILQDIGFQHTSKKLDMLFYNSNLYLRQLQY